MRMTGNTILITGGTSGIGRALAERFHDQGNSVIITGRRKELLDEITAVRPGIIGMVVDLNDAESVNRMSRDVRLRFPELNVLIANAGISRIENLCADNWEATDAIEIVQTNIVGLLRTTAALLPVLKAQSSATIMATSSALAFVPRADFPAYCASKAFLHSWLMSVRHQFRATSVEVLELSPPYVQTALTGDVQKSDPRAMPLMEYVEQVMALLEQRDHANGEVLLERDYARRWAERDGRFEAVFSTLNPS